MGYLGWLFVVSVILGCRWHWSCWWLHPWCWSGFYRRVGIMVLCGAVLSISNLGAPLVFTLRVLYVLGCTCSSYLGVGWISLIFPRPIGFDPGFFVGVGGVLITRLNCGEHIGALSIPLFLPSDLAPYHTAAFHSFQQKYWPAVVRPHVYCRQFIRSAPPALFLSKTFLYWWLPLWYCLFLTRRSF